jgi:hypothetical protein
MISSAAFIFLYRQPPKKELTGFTSVLRTSNFVLIILSIKSA